MTQEEQTDAFSQALEGLMIRYVEEFDLTYASMIGVLTVAIHVLAEEAVEGDG